MCFYDTIPSLTLTKGAVLLMKNQKRTLISCAMLEDEVNHILEKTHLTLPVIWIDRGLHNRPENLNQLLQEHINQLQTRMRFCLPLVCAATVLQGLSVRTQCCVCQNLTIVSICLPVVSQGQKENKHRKMPSI